VRCRSRTTQRGTTRPGGTSRAGWDAKPARAAPCDWAAQSDRATKTGGAQRTTGSSGLTLQRLRSVVGHSHSGAGTAGRGQRRTTRRRSVDGRSQRSCDYPSDLAAQRRSRRRCQCHEEQAGQQTPPKAQWWQHRNRSHGRQCPMELVPITGLESSRLPTISRRSAGTITSNIRGPISMPPTTTVARGRCT